MAYLVEVSARARRDLDAIYEYIQAAESEHAFTWFRSLATALRSLSELPYRSPVTPECYAGSGPQNRTACSSTLSAPQIPSNHFFPFAIIFSKKWHFSFAQLATIEIEIEAGRPGRHAGSSHLTEAGGRLCIGGKPNY